MSQLEAIKKLDAYRVVEHKMIEEMQSEGIVLEHKKTKARLFLVSNDDENKVFSIGFRTPPDNDSTECRTFWSTACCAVPRSSR